MGSSGTEAYSGSEGAFHLERLPNGWLVGRFAALEAVGIAHLVTTREGPDVQQVRHDPAAAGREIVRVLGLEDTAFLEQVHGGDVLVSEQGGCAGFADGLATTATGLALLGKSGDCPIILMADRRRRAVGFAHASWRATVAGVAPAVLRRMVDLGCEPGDLLACICPAAGPCCYEVGDEVRTAAIESIGLHAAAFLLPAGRQRQTPFADGSSDGSGTTGATSRRELGADEITPGAAVPRDAAARPGKLHFDLWHANADALVRAGLKPGAIHIAGICTLCRNDLFPSHRREGDAAGRFAAVIGLPGICP